MAVAVTPETIAVALGRTAPDVDSPTWGQWDMWIGDALVLIDARKAELGVAGPLDQAKLDYVVREAVVAQVKRPDDAHQVTISVDDASTSKTYRSGRGRVTILDEWWALLGLTPPSGGAFSVDTIGAGSQHLPWCDLYFNGATCSCGVAIAGYPIFEGGW